MLCQPPGGARRGQRAWQGAWLVFSSKKAGAWTGKGREVAASVRRGVVSTSWVSCEAVGPALEPNPVSPGKGCPAAGPGWEEPCALKWACARRVGRAAGRRVTAVLPQCLGDVPGGQDPPSRGRKESSVACPLACPSLWVAQPAHPRPNLCPACRAGRRPAGPCPPPWAGTHSPVFSEDDSSETHWGGSWAVYHRPALATGYSGSWGRGQLAW